MSKNQRLRLMVAAVSAILALIAIVSIITMAVIGSAILRDTSAYDKCQGADDAHFLECYERAQQDK